MLPGGPVTKRIGVLRRHVEPEGGGVARGEAIRVLSSSGASSSSSSASGLVDGFEPGRLLLNRRVIVTGAGAGIGYAAALLFAAHGARLVLCDLDEERLRAASDFIRNAGSRSCVTLAGDVTDQAYVQRVIDLAVAEFGGIDDLVLNAGFTWDGVLHKTSDEQWRAMLDVHISAPRTMIKLAAPYMRDAAKAEIAANGTARPRSVLTVGSVSGTHGNAGQTNYAAAKAGVVGLTKSLAKEWGPFNVRANAVVFGHIETRLTADKAKGASIRYRGREVKLGIPHGNVEVVGDVVRASTALGRTGTADEAAGAMLMLLSPYASYITGQAVEVTGGGWM